MHALVDIKRMHDASARTLSALNIELASPIRLANARSPTRPRHYLADLIANHFVVEALHWLLARSTRGAMPYRSRDLCLRVATLIDSKALTWKHSNRRHDHACICETTVREANDKRHALLQGVVRALDASDGGHDARLLAARQLVRRSHWSLRAEDLEHLRRVIAPYLGAMARVAMREACVNPTADVMEALTCLCRR